MSDQVSDSHRIPGFSGFLAAFFIVLAPLVVASGSRAVDVQIVPAFPNLDFGHLVFLTAPPDGTDRIFVVEQAGTIEVFPNDPGVSSSTTFLDIRDVVWDDNNEQGLLGLAFDPDYANNGYFYTNYTYNDSADCSNAGDNCNTRIVRYSVSAGDPNVADPGSALILLEFNQPSPNHNGGMLAFSPADGMLYIGTGDGGRGASANGQDKNTLLGAILRIDPHAPESNYIPPGNPFGSAIWHYGLRNPWRFSFDRQAPHDLWIGDVGQALWEEIDFAQSDESGFNFGWAECEGNHAYGAAQDSDCQAGNANGYTPPVIEYSTTGWHSVTGGYVYRGSRAPLLRGMYVYADYQGPKMIWAWDRSTLGADGLGVPEVIGSVDRVTSLGEDEAGELYIVEQLGTIYTVVPEPSSALLQWAGLLVLGGLVLARSAPRSCRALRNTIPADDPLRCSRAP